MTPAFVFVILSLLEYPRSLTSVRLGALYGFAFTFNIAPNASNSPLPRTLS